MPLNDQNEPAHIPIHYEVHIGLTGLRAGDKDLLGRFWYTGYSNIEFIYNTNSKMIVLHLGVNFNEIHTVNFVKAWLQTFQ